MENDFIEMMEPTPELDSKKCKAFALFIQLILQYTTLLSAVVAWYMYDYFIAGATFLLLFVIMGIVRAQLRNSSIPMKQQEYHYNDKGIANWYVAKNFCLSKELE
ncbi:MAG: hypothetical protein JXQ67_06000 [Campylobacterales bacterium]|nr:hypothetical protein [Campylobacterales bacterium]